MPDSTTQPRPATDRDLRFFRSPHLWRLWPFLPVVRRRPGRDMEYGVLYDCWSVSGRPGYSATVLFTNLFLMPQTEEKLLALPKEVYDTAEEVAAAGWRVD